MRVEQIGAATLYLGDCRQILPALRELDAAVVSDPPYGMKWNTDSSRFSGGHNPADRGGRADWGDIVDDDVPFDPAPWLEFRQAILWGANHFAARLPVGTLLVWLKRNDQAFGTFLSDAEVAWMKGGHGIYCRRDLSLNGATGTHARAHPTQKPVGLMRWCVGRTSGTVLDPYMGSGTTGVACVHEGRPFVGVEVCERYFDAACRRIAEAYRQPSIFVTQPEAPPALEQHTLFEVAK